jgi:hypothetical protein
LDLQHATAQLLTNVIEEGRYLALLYCYYSEHSFRLFTKTGLEVASLDTKTSRILEDLQQSIPLYYECIMSMQKWEQATASTNDTRILTMDLNIHGPPEAADVVATQLYHADMYLQDPLWHASDVSYVNPQHIDFPGVTTYESFASPESSVREETPQGFTVQELVTENAVADFSQLLDVLGQHDHLALEAADAHIATRLLEYQA